MLIKKHRLVKLIEFVTWAKRSSINKYLYRWWYDITDPDIFYECLSYYYKKKKI